MLILLIIGGIESNPGPINNKKLSNNITIAHVNINSITATGKVQELTNFVDVNKITILALTETKLDDSINPNLYTRGIPRQIKHRNPSSPSIFLKICRQTGHGSKLSYV